MVFELYSILNRQGSVTGYVVGEYYLSIEQARMFFKGYVNVESMYGDRRGIVIVSRTKKTELTAKSVNAGNYFDFMAKCIQDKADMHDVLFIPCRVEDFDWDTKNEIWRLPKCHLYQCMQGVKFLGYLLTDKSIYTEKHVMVVMLEMLQKNKGHGTLVVDKLKSHSIKLSGLSTVDAMSFWNKQGAVFTDCNRFTIS